MLDACHAPGFRTERISSVSYPTLPSSMPAPSTDTPPEMEIVPWERKSALIDFAGGEWEKRHVTKLVASHAGSIGPATHVSASSAAAAGARGVGCVCRVTRLRGRRRRRA